MNVASYRFRQIRHPAGQVSFLRSALPPHPVRWIITLTKWYALACGAGMLAAVASWPLLNHQPTSPTQSPTTPRFFAPSNNPVQIKPAVQEPDGANVVATAPSDDSADAAALNRLAAIASQLFLGTMSSQLDATTQAHYTNSLNSETIQALIQKGYSLMQAGNLASARALFSKAAQTGNNDAMLAMGATYDPAVVGNVNEARRWYQQAADAGNVKAPMLLRRLPASSSEIPGSMTCGVDGRSTIFLDRSTGKFIEFCKDKPRMPLINSIDGKTD